MTRKIPSSAIRLIRTEEGSERLAGSMNFDDTRHRTVTQSNPGSPKISPFALGVLEPGSSRLDDVMAALMLEGCIAIPRPFDRGRSAASRTLTELYEIVKGRFLVAFGFAGYLWSLVFLFSTMIFIFRRPDEKHRHLACAMSRP